MTIRKYKENVINRRPTAIKFFACFVFSFFLRSVYARIMSYNTHKGLDAERRVEMNTNSNVILSFKR